jgi:hypothetical protein
MKIECVFNLENGKIEFLSSEKKKKKKKDLEKRKTKKV